MSELPTPAPARVRPIREPAGQLGEASSSRPLLERAAAIAASGQRAIPAILPTTPGGRVGESLVISSSPSWRVRRRLKGE